MTNKQIELRSEYESEYLYYANGKDFLEFDEWLTKYKGFKPSKRMVKESIKAELIEQFKKDIKHDWSVLDDLLDRLPVKILLGSLDENEWEKYPSVKM